MFEDFKQADKYPLIPIGILLLLYMVFMPWSGSPGIFTLELHQQVIAISALPTIIGSLYWFLKVNPKPPSETSQNRSDSE